MKLYKQSIFTAIVLALGLQGCDSSGPTIIIDTDQSAADVAPPVTVPATDRNNPDDLGSEQSVTPAVTTDNGTDGGIDTGTSDTGTDTSGGTTAEPQEPIVVASDDWWRPKASDNLKWQWQLQGKIDTTLPVQVYNIDIEVPQGVIDELKARDIKIICYFSAGTVEYFREDSVLFPLEFIGERYEDLPDEQWVDYGNIESLAPIMRARMDTCKAKGFDAIEIDNVDAHNYETRDETGEVIGIGTNFKMTLDESIAYVRWLTNEAHSRGLGIGLKNAEEMVPDVVNEVDWMLVEDCYFDSWCMAATAFIDADKPVFMAEYDELVPDFTPACELAKSLGYSAIWRDTSLANGVYLACE